MTKLKINNTMKDEDITWKKIKCKCDKSDIEKCFPLIDCKYCECKKREDSMPREQFEIKYEEFDENNEPTGKIITKIIKEITIDRSTDGYDSIRGWSF